jgi:alkylation response protein AidB-like acyl-CoA dehydrogenase
MGVCTGVGEAFGGQGAFDAVTALMIAEELAWGDPGVAYSVLAPGVVASVLQRAALPAQQAGLLPELAAGGGAALAVAEREAGADIFRMDTTAETGCLRGVKYAVPDPGPGGMLLVVAQGPSIWRVAPGAAAGAAAEDKLGLRSARTLKLALDGVGAEPIGVGPAEVVAALLAAKLVTAGIALGLARAAVEYAAAYARERTAFGRPIGAFQGISFMIADRATDLEAARLLCWEAGSALEAAQPDVDRLVMAACGQAVGAALAASDDAVQILGGHGYMRDHPVELWYRDAMTLATLDAPWLVGDLFLAGGYRAGGLP